MGIRNVLTIVGMIALSWLLVIGIIYLVAKFAVTWVFGVGYIAR